MKMDVREESKKNFMSSIQDASTSLRNTETCDRSCPKISNQFAETEKDYNAYQETVLDIIIEEWYDLLAPYTFTTEFIPISEEEAQLFVDHFYIETSLHDNGETFEALTSSVDLEKLNKEILNLQCRVQIAIDHLQTLARSRGDPEYCFVKTSSRSPKDANYSKTNLQTIFEELVLQENESDAPDENMLLNCLLKAGKRCMCIQTAAAAMNLLLNSRRIYQDYTLALAHTARWNQNLIIRQWQEIDVDLEFRCFVRKGRLVAISQYHHLCFFPRIACDQNAAFITKKISEMFDTHIQPALASKFESYVVDFGLLNPCHTNNAVEEEDGVSDSTVSSVGVNPVQKLVNADVVVIELNPYLETTDACCFDWSRDALLLQGGDPSASSSLPPPPLKGHEGTSTTGFEVPEYRVTRRPMKGGKSMLYENSRELIEKVTKNWRSNAAADEHA